MKPFARTASAVVTAAVSAGLLIGSFASPAQAAPFTTSPALAELTTTQTTAVKWSKRKRRNVAIGAGIAVGIIGAAIVAKEAKRERRRERAWERHVRRCYAAYASYDEYTDTWIDRKGRERRCRK